MSTLVQVTIHTENSAKTFQVTKETADKLRQQFLGYCLGHKDAAKFYLLSPVIDRAKFPNVKRAETIVLYDSICQLDIVELSEITIPDVEPPRIINLNDKLRSS